MAIKVPGSAGESAGPSKAPLTKTPIVPDPNRIRTAAKVTPQQQAARDRVAARGAATEQPIARPKVTAQTPPKTPSNVNIGRQSDIDKAQANADQATLNQRQQGTTAKATTVSRPAALTVPTRRPGRPNFNPQTDGAPETMDEVNKTRAWINGAETPRIASIVRDADGRYMYGGTQRSASDADIAIRLRIDEARAGIQQTSLLDQQYSAEEYQRQIETRFDSGVENAMKDYNLEAIKSVTERDAMKREQENKLAQLEAQRDNELALLEERNRFDTGLLERQQSLDIAREDMKFQFEREQSSLDRALRSQELGEAERASQAMEQLRRDESNMQMDRLKLDIFQAISSNPQMLYFLGQSGALGLFGDLMGDGGNALNSMMNNINNTQAANAQQFATMSAEQQGAQRFAFTAQTGNTDPDAVLQGAAPRGFGNQVYPFQPGGVTPSNPINLGG